MKEIRYTNFLNMQSISVSSKLSCVTAIDIIGRMLSNEKKAFDLLDIYELGKCDSFIIVLDNTL